MTTMLSLKSGHDVRYLTSSSGMGGCAGAMSYYTADGEPPGQWDGHGAAGLGLAGEVDAQVISNLYMENIGPGGERLAGRVSKGDERAEDAAVAAFRKAHPYASGTEIGEYRARQRAKGGPQSVPYFDFTINLVKSVSILHASYRVGAQQARARGADDEADALDARADAIEGALVDAARDLVRYLEERHAYTRTGYHSSTTGEWRDAAGMMPAGSTVPQPGGGLTAAIFVHHISRDGDPHLHAHVGVWNRVQLAEADRRARHDEKWRTLYGRNLYQNKLGAAVVPDRFVEARLRQLGYVMVPRADGNGCEVGGVDQAVMDQFSSRSVAVTGELARLAGEYERVHGHPPSPRTLWLLHQQALQNTKRPKAQARRTVGGKVHSAELDPAARLKAWEAQTTAEEMRALSRVRADVEAFARARALPSDPDGDGADPAPAAAPGSAPAAAPGAPGGADSPGFGLTPLPDRWLTGEDRARIARVAVANVQKRHAAFTMAQLRFEVHRAAGAGITADDIDEIARVAISGRANTGAIQVGAAPDVADVTPLGVRPSDGVSVYRPPGEERWSTIGHLDTEQQIVEEAKRPTRQLVSEAEARAAVAETDLTLQQAEAVVAMLTASTVTVPLNAAPGSGKSHVMGVFSHLWTRFTGARVIGLTTSTNAARVLENEGLAESYNIAQFLGKTAGSDELRHPVPVHPDDVLVVDEATQASTADLAMLYQVAREAGARLDPVGDTEQLGAVEAGGVFALLVEEIDGPRMEEILRFRNQWEAGAAERLRDRDRGVFAVYDRRGRIRAGDHEAIFDQAAAAWVADHMRGRESLLLAGSNTEAADLARRAQALLAKLGKVGPGLVELSDGNMAGAGDLIRARLNTHIDAGGRRLTNRDQLRLTGGSGATETGGRFVTAVRNTGRDPKTGRPRWSAPFPVTVGYAQASAELDYAGNVHVAQGRTVDTGHEVLTHSVNRRGHLVGMTRGRESNTAWVETGNTAPPGKKAYEQATPESVWAGAMDREPDDLSATATMRAGQEWASGSGHVLHLWSVAVRESLYPTIDRLVAARLDATQRAKYLSDHARKAFRARLREAQLAGHDLSELIDRVTATPLKGARSVASVLHSRLAGLGLDTRHDVSWEQRTPEDAPELARELAAGLDDRVREMGERAAAKPEPWLLRRLGVLDPKASPNLRGEYERRAGVAAAYREAAGITNPEQDVAMEPHSGNPELETWRKAAMHALEIRDDAERMASMSLGELEAAIAEGDRAVAAAPPDVTSELRLTEQARTDAWAQAAVAEAEGTADAARSAEALARQLDADADRLNPAAVTYEQWSAATAASRDEAGKAKLELDRRGGGPDAGRPVSDWWAEFAAQADAAEAAIEAERQAAEREGRPWPPPRPQAQREPQAGTLDGLEPGQEPLFTVGEIKAASETIPEPQARVAEADVPAGEGVHVPDVPDVPEPEPDVPDVPEPPQPDPGPGPAAETSGPEPAPDQEPLIPASELPPPPEPEPRRLPEPVPEPAADLPEPEPAAELAARLDELQAQATEAAARVQQEAADQQASSDFTARMRAEAETAPEPSAAWQAEYDGDMEPEM